jgi:tetratricopeptide (TPR) repeat protein
MSTTAKDRPSICLAMIVRDESAVIERCVESVREHIDSWVICDTGSVDGTQDVIRKTLADLPGELHERPWIDFGHNRTELMKLARGKADYLLLLDADWTVTIEPGALDNLDADSYMVRHSGEFEFHNKRLVRGDRDWWFVGAAHEYIASEGEETVERLDGVVIDHWADGGARTGRWERDAELLKAELDRDPANARAAFYLAQTYRDLGDRKQAIELYRRRAGMGGWEEEVYNALHQVGVLSAEEGDWGAAMDALVSAWEARPQRLEAVYELASRLRLRHQYRAAHQFARVAEGLEPLPIPDDSLFVAPWVYRWGLLFEYSISSYWVGELGRAFAATERLLKLDDLPEVYRRQTRENQSHTVRAMAAAEGRVRPAPPARSTSSTAGRLR